MVLYGEITMTAIMKFIGILFGIPCLILTIIFYNMGITDAMWMMLFWTVVCVLITGFWSW